jgi:homoprotocatechuate degradation regulator HpaR
MSQALRDFSRSLPMALLRAREAVMERFRPLLRRHGVTEQQWRVLRAVEASAETSASSLAATTCIGLPSLSRILGSLEARGLIVRRVKATDLRTTLVSLSAAGARLLRKAGAESEARYQALSREIGDEDMRRLYALLDRVAAARGNHQARAAASRANGRERRVMTAHATRQGRAGTVAERHRSRSTP